MKSLFGLMWEIVAPLFAATLVAGSMDVLASSVEEERQKYTKEQISKESVSQQLRIVFWVSTGERGIYVMNADGSDLNRLTNSRWDDLPLWSSDGERIAFRSIRDSDARELEKYKSPFHKMLYIMDSNGNNKKRLITTPVALYWWSPDGKKIAFQSSSEGEEFRGRMTGAIYIMDRDGKNLSELKGSQHASFPSWSPDGRRLAMISGRGIERERNGTRISGSTEIYIMNADGSGQRKLTDTSAADVDDPVWSPDGKRIAFELRPLSKTPGSLPDQKIYVVDGTGKNLRRLTNTPGNEGLRAWSPDGSKILFTSTADWQLPQSVRIGSDLTRKDPQIQIDTGYNGFS